MTESTMLFRQIHPSFFQGGQVTSQAFRPTPKDANRLSVYDGDQLDAESSWQHYTANLNLQSIGVLAPIVQECKSIDLPVIPDRTPFPEHVVIDFNGCSKKQIENKSKRLRAFALARGWQYRPEAGDE